MTSETAHTTHVRYFGLAQQELGLSEDTVELSPDATVGDLLKALARKHGDRLREMLVVGGTELIPNATVTVNGRDIHHKGWLDSPLPRSGSVRIVVLPPASGGG